MDGSMIMDEDMMNMDMGSMDMGNSTGGGEGFCTGGMGMVM
jgi:hypothetical protein